MSGKEILIVALGGSVVGLHMETGEQAWRNNMTLGGHAWVALAVASDRVYASASAKKLFCIDRQSGETLWAAPTTGLGRATLLIAEERIIICKGGLVDCFSTDGSIVWSQNLKRLGKGVAAMGLTDNVVQADG